MKHILNSLIIIASISIFNLFAISCSNNKDGNKTTTTDSTAKPNYPKVIIKSPQDYIQVMEKFKVLYNKQQFDSISYMFEDPEQGKKFIPTEMWKEIYINNGMLISYKYMAQDTGDNNLDVALFKTTYTLSVHAFGFSLNENNKFGTFRLHTSSEFIDKLLANEL